MSFIVEGGGLIDTGSYKTRLIAYQCVFRACSLKQDGALAVKYWKLFKFQTSMTPKLVPDAKLYRCVLSRPFPSSSLPPSPLLSTSRPPLPAPPPAPLQCRDRGTDLQLAALPSSERSHPRRHRAA